MKIILRWLHITFMILWRNDLCWIGVGTGLQLQEILKFRNKDIRDKDSIEASIGTKNIKRTFQLTSGGDCQALNATMRGPSFASIACSGPIPG